jgi:alkanesulfonate monooxygenase SsuD/methylene tetrahydromethanopterin reductase-like flavin-dependent oxidoreductase (luciferase family)
MDGRSPAHALDDLSRQACLAESLGYHSVWLPESHFEANGACPAPLLILAAVAARTQRICLGTTSYLLPVRHPLRVAEDVAVLDQLSGGRVILGVGRGFRPSLFQAFRIPAGEKRARFEASLAAVLRAWRGESIGEVPGAEPRRQIRVTPRPLQRPHPPIWVAAFGPKALAQAGRLGLPYLASPVEPIERLCENYARHRAALPEGIAASDLPVPVIRTVFVSRERSRIAEVREALAHQARAASRRLARPHLADDVDAWALAGEPARVADAIVRYRERIGLSHLIARVRVPGASPAEIESSLRSLAEVVASLA